MEIYKEQYGVHLDPRAAYQRCQKLQYEQLSSLQGLLDAMKDYLRMAPNKLTDDVLESILLNLSLYIKLEFSDGSVQALVNKLLKAELALEERARRNTDKDRKIAYGQGKLQNWVVKTPSA